MLFGPIVNDRAKLATKPFCLLKLGAPTLPDASSRNCISAGTSLQTKNKITNMATLLPIKLSVILDRVDA
jgi:hypothetical protein